MWDLRVWFYICHQICLLNYTDEDGFYLTVMSICNCILAHFYQWVFRVHICRDVSKSDLNPRCSKNGNLHAPCQSDAMPSLAQVGFVDFTYIISPLFLTYLLLIVSTYAEIIMDTISRIILCLSTRKRFSTRGRDVSWLPVIAYS
jgi:hypothetical protein